MLVTCANELKIWEIENFNLLNEYVFSKSINWLSIKSDNNYISTIVNNDSINLINLETQAINTYDNVESKCCCFDSFGRLLAVGNLNGSLDIYDFKANIINSKKRNYKIHNSAINCISWSKNDRFLATGNNSGSIILFNAISNQISKPLYIHNKICEVTYISHSVNQNQHLASSYADGSDILWDTTKEKPVVQFKQHMQPSTCILLSPLNNVFMLSGGLDSLLICYDVLAKKSIKSILVPGGITTLDMYKDGSTVAVGTINGNVQMYDLRSNTDEPFYSYVAHDTAVKTLKFLYSTLNNNSSSKSISVENSDLDKTTKQNGLLSCNSPVTIPSSLTIRNSTSVVDNLNIETTTSNSQRILLTKSNSAFNMNSNNYNISIDKDNRTDFLTSCNIYSPEIIKTESTQNNNSPTNAFVLHKNQINITPITNHEQPDNSINNSKYLSLNIKSKSQLTPDISNLREKADLFSPISTNNQIQHPKSLASDNINQEYLKNDLKNTLKSIQPSQADTKYEENKHVDILKQYTSGMTPLIANNKIASCKQKSSSITVGNITNDQINATIDLQTTPIPIEQIKEIIKDSIEEFKDELMTENFRFKAEILKEFIILKQELRMALQSCSLNDALIDEIAKLREENKRLKKLF